MLLVRKPLSHSDTAKTLSIVSAEHYVKLGNIMEGSCRYGTQGLMTSYAALKLQV
jgi:hypothetical protein